MRIQDLLKAIRTCAGALTTLQIVTAVAEAQTTQGQRLLQAVDSVDIPKIKTEIDLLQGDITTVFHPSFITGAYMELREFHAQREQQGLQRINDNLEALKKLYEFAETLFRKEDEEE